MEDDIKTPYEVIKAHLEEKRYEGVDRIQIVVRGYGLDTPNEIIYSILRDMERAGEIRRTGDVLEWTGS
jgi:hypothetical protein